MRVCFVDATFHIIPLVHLLFTGPTSGIGLETARVLALRGVHVVMAARNLKQLAMSDGSSISLSKDGIESQFATNYLGHFHLTNLLLDTMKHTARSRGQEGRIVLVSSVVHRLTYKEGIMFDKLNDEKRYNEKRHILEIE
ncbi:putative very-long-chain 3-oxoacyl-CoA reductase [Helianthus annuus]|nr:putative very-long-chain 3-oxoacyl-CoA reductase [Helianthus annuus]